MKKRIISLLLALVLAATLLPVQAWGATVVGSGYCGGEGDGKNLTWTLDSDGVLTISGDGEMKDYRAKSSPWYSRRTSITKLVVQNGVSTIGEYAFYYCEKIKNASFPNSLTQIGKSAFALCFQLSDIVFPAQLIDIGDYAFGSCNLTKIKIPNSIRHIGNSVFSRNHKLESFSVDSENQNYCAVDGILFNKNMTSLIRYP